jgi:cytochrome b-561
MLADEKQPLLSPPHHNIMSATEDTDWLHTTAGSRSAANEDFSAPVADTGASSVKANTLQRLQSIAIIISLILSPISIILVSVWASALGGVSWKEGESKLVFNWHPVMMITAYAIMNFGALVFRISGTSSYQAGVGMAPERRGKAKVMHASLWTLSFVFGLVGIIAVFKSHNDSVSGYIANLYSLHSWVGMTVLTNYISQFLFGALVFGGVLKGSRLRNPVMMELHKFSGAYIHILAMAAILMGIQEKEGFVGCAYKVESADLIPILNYGKIPYACKISHGLGLVILFMGLFTSFGLARFPAV